VLATPAALLLLAFAAINGPLRERAWYRATPKRDRL